MFASFRIKSLSPHSEFSQHLSERDFFMMVGFAIVVHLLVLTVIQLLPRDEVLQIPVRSLNIKFGGSGMGDTPQTPNIGLPEAGGGAPGSATEPASEPDGAAQPAMKTLESVISEAPVDVATPREMPKPKADKPVAAQKNTTEKSLPSNLKPQAISEATMKAAEQLPSEYIRGGGQGGQKAGDNFGVKGGTAGGVGIGNGDGTSGEFSDAEVLRRYEQIISLWIQRNKVYPASAKARGLQGQAIVRIRINRNGNVVFSRLDKPTAHAELNEAITAMIRASNPVPAVPSNYPAGNLFEFLIPVSFRLE